MDVSEPTPIILIYPSVSPTPFAGAVTVSLPWVRTVFHPSGRSVTVKLLIPTISTAISFDSPFLKYCLPQNETNCCCISERKGTINLVKPSERVSTRQSSFCSTSENKPPVRALSDSVQVLPPSTEISRRLSSLIFTAGTTDVTSIFLPPNSRNSSFPF